MVHQVEAQTRGSRRAGEVDGHVRPTTRQVQYRLHRIAGRHVHDMVRTNLECYIQPKGIIVGSGHDHGSCAQQSRIRRAGQTHVTWPLNHDRLAFPETDLFQPRHHVGQGFEQGQFFGRHGVGQRG